MHCFRIGDIDIALAFDDFSITEDAFCLPFAVSEMRAEPCIQFYAAPINQARLQTAKVERYLGGNELLSLPEGQFFVNHWCTCRYAYGFSLQELHQSDRVPIYFHEEMRQLLPLPMMRLLSSIGLHSKLLQKNISILHASYIDYRGNAILFAAPSQTGKSTQAALWARHAGAEIINGDRVLLRKQENRWYAYGYPCCGSSKISLNRTLPIAAIVLLQQGTENRVEQVSGSERLRALLSGTELFPWYAEDLERAIPIAQALSDELPMLRLTCTADEDAVHTLKTYLEVHELARHL